MEWTYLYGGLFGAMALIILYILSVLDSQRYDVCLVLDIPIGSVVLPIYLQWACL